MRACVYYYLSSRTNNKRRRCLHPRLSVGAKDISRNGVLGVDASKDASLNPAVGKAQAKARISDAIDATKLAASSTSSGNDRLAKSLQVPVFVSSLAASTINPLKALESIEQLASLLKGASLKVQNHRMILMERVSVLLEVRCRHSTIRTAATVVRARRRSLEERKAINVAHGGRL